jgi:hypothetical protein
MAINVTREQRRKLARENANQPLTLQTVNRDAWPDPVPRGLVRVWRSRDFLVQVFQENGIVGRLSVCRTSLDGDRWRDNIAWDDLQRLKRECGYGDFDAVEVYPADADVVNDANIRHLWIMPNPLPFAWRKQEIAA